MEIEVLEKKENALLDRIEIRFKAVHKEEATPSRDEIREKIAKSLKASKDRVILDFMSSVFGLPQTTGYAKVYKNVDSAKKHERKHILIRNGLLEAEEKKEKQEKKEKPVKQPVPEDKEKPAEDKKEKTDASEKE